jgi:hypothetical protein
MANRLFREDAEDTGETDVRELRARFGAMQPEREEQHDITEAEIEHELLVMVEAGELIFGWIEDRQEFGFWFPEEPAKHPLQVPQRPASHRRKRTMALQRMIIGIAAVVATPLLAGVIGTRAVEDSHTSSHVVTPETNTDASVFSDVVRPKQVDWYARSTERHTP